jgi:RNA polymerase sigma-70 factor (ECF subfamily)
LKEKEFRAEFDRIALPHLDAAYNLARWLTRHDQDAEDVVQEAFLRAYRFFRSFHGETGRAWLLQIVRNTCHTWLARNRPAAGSTVPPQVFADLPGPAANPHAVLERRENEQLLLQAVADLPVEFREVIVLRELEDLSYKEIARIAGVPLGTVMSRLARGRERLHEILERTVVGEGSDGMP